MRTNRRIIENALAALLLGGITLALYYQACDHDFVSFDDHQYVTDVKPVLEGVTPKNLLWLFQYDEVNCPHPLTYLSLMLDSTLYGNNPSAYLFTSILFHSASAILLFLLLRSNTGNLFASFAVAAVFAWHPMRAESVAWISERKDVLSLFFAILTVAGYCLWHKERKPFQYIWAVLVPFALALLSKPSVVVLPCVLMLLDIWPLRRFPGENIPPGFAWWAALARGAFRSVHEKIPLFIAGAIFAALTFQLSHAYGITVPWDVMPLSDRIQNMVHAYVRYLEKFFIPLGLTPLHVHPGLPPPLPKTLWYAALLCLITLLAIVRAPRRPAAFVGWIWFLGVLLPVSGLLQNGAQLTADRYTYLPYIGLGLAVFHGVIFSPASTAYRKLAAIPVAAWLAWLAWVTASVTVPAWQNTASLWAKALAENPRNLTALKSIASSHGTAGEYAMGLPYSRAGVDVALQLWREPSPALKFGAGPQLLEDLKSIHYRLLALSGRTHQAEAWSRRFPGILVDPESALVRAMYLVRDGRLAQAEMTLRLPRTDPKARVFHAMALRELGQIDKAKLAFADILKEHPDHVMSIIQAAATDALVPGADLDQAAENARLAGNSDAASINDSLCAAIAYAYIRAKQGRIEEAEATIEDLGKYKRFQPLLPALTSWLQKVQPPEVPFPQILSLSSQLGSPSRRSGEIDSP